ncbi:MAG: hypothetical protein RLN76_05075 [Phycisphaeraceae bacterium]
MRAARTAMLALSLTLAGAAIAQDAEPVSGHPQPQIISTSWNLDFSFDTPKAIAVTDPAGVTRWYWFMTYKVANNTGQERLFVPEVDIADDNGRIVAANRSIPPAVYAEVERVINNQLLQSPTESVGRLLQGDDFARETYAVWEAPFEDADLLTVFIGGLSGETASIAHPDPEIDERIQLRRTRMLRFSLPGFFENPQYQPVELIDERDVMR